MVEADVAALMSDQFKSLRRGLKTRHGLFEGFVSTIGRWMENRPKEGEPPKPGLGGGG